MPKNLDRNVEAFRTASSAHQRALETANKTGWKLASLALEGTVLFGATQREYAKLVGQSQGHVSRLVGLWKEYGDWVERPNFTEAYASKKAGRYQYPAFLHAGAWFTPHAYVESARQALGGIDLDPASCKKANKNVKAGAFYTERDDGLVQPWFGRVFLNPPYSVGLLEPFITKLARSFAADDIDAAICLTPSYALSNKYFSSMWDLDPIVCITTKRIAFGHPDEAKAWETSSFGSAFTYLGPHPEQFAREFEQWGIVLVRP
jgi:phage N-6-adenine-methyltransferase